PRRRPFPRQLRDGVLGVQRPEGHRNRRRISGTQGGRRMIRGVDISSYQADYKVEPGLDFIIVKASEGRSATNWAFDKQAKMARESGLVVGFYAWLHHGNVKAQAKFFVDKVRPRVGEFLVCDWETNRPGGNPEATVAEKDEFIAEVKRLAPHCRVGLYLNPSWDRERNNGRYGDFLWIANYVNDDEPRTDADWLIWQYTEKPRDYNRARFGSRAEMAAWARGDLEPVKPTPVYKRPKLKERVSWRGGRTCTCVIESVEKVVEPRLKAAGVIKYSVDFYQLGYRTDVSASAGTHAGGGVVDVAQYSDKAIRIWRECGWAMWHRTPAQGFMHHGHGVLEGCPHLPPAARSQLTQYHNGTNGLRGHGK